MTSWSSLASLSWFMSHTAPAESDRGNALLLYSRDFEELHDSLTYPLLLGGANGLHPNL